MSYPRLSIEDFGRQLIETGDLDPVYIALAKVEWPEVQRKRFLVAYWLFYHPGAACYMSQPQPGSSHPGIDFWAWVKRAAENDLPAPTSTRVTEDRWPRASERRHFRGDKAVRAVDELARRFPGGHELVTMVAEAAPSYNSIFNRVCSLPQFGPWMAFKVADMLERCMGIPVDFDLGSVTMFDDPKQAALMLARQRVGLPDNAKFKDPGATVRRVVEHLIEHFEGWSAPPAHDRPVGYQEVETILCKWKSHMNGHYPVGKDCREIREGLEAWAAVAPSAAEFLHWMPTGDQAPATSGAA
jgi:hypothetical protein